MKTVYDFLSPEERRWIVRCQVVAVLLFLGLLATIAASDHKQPMDRGASSREAGNRAVAAEPPGVIHPGIASPQKP